MSTSHLIVSLVSEQTIPNVHFIKEYKTKQYGDSFYYLFISTQVMNEKGVVEWICKASSININEYQVLTVNEYSLEDIRSQLESFDYSIYDKVSVNITGGTKIMSMAAFDFFKGKNFCLYYITGKNNNYLKLYPENDSQSVIDFTSKISVKEYLDSYGFTYSATEPSGIATEVTERMFQKYCEGVFDDYIPALEILRAKRNSRLLKGNDFKKIKDFIAALEYVPDEESSLTQLEVKYLSGEWFEEFIYAIMKEDLGLDKEDIMTGVEISKNGSKNEIDVMFMYEGRFHVIECKTSIFNMQYEVKDSRTKKGEINLDSNGQPVKDIKQKSVNILKPTLYQADAIKTKFGLFAKSYIFTLTDLQNEREVQDVNRRNNMLNLENRAQLSNITLVDKSKLVNRNNAKELL